MLVFIAVSAWWLIQDDRIQIWDGGYHMGVAFTDSQSLAHGHLTLPFTTYFLVYPPLVHLVGAISILLVGFHPMSLVMTSNVVFVPLLAFGCYGTGKLVAGPRAGLLAGLFGLCTPMFVSMMHEVLIDTPQAAIVAVSVWALLASRRWERVGGSAIAGAMCGLALMTKETSVVFLAGPGLMLLIRGGWRNWRGLLAFVAALGVIAGPWYGYHWNEIVQSYTQIGQLQVNGVQSPPRFSVRNFAWYFWNLLNQQALLPFTAAFVAGVVISIRRCLRRPLDADNMLPELLAGFLVSYAGMTYLTHKDPRYTLPFLVYVAVLGTCWIPQIARRGLNRALTAAVVAVAIMNFVGMSTGLGGTHRAMVALPGAPSPTMIYPWRLTIYENQGWLRGGPEHDGDLRALLMGLRASGVRSVTFGSNVENFSAEGAGPMLTELHLTALANPTETPDSVYLFLHIPKSGQRRPCQVLSGGLGPLAEPLPVAFGLYAVRGRLTGFDPDTLDDPAAPRRRYDFVCPA